MTRPHDAQTPIIALRYVTIHYGDGTHEARGVSNLEEHLIAALEAERELVRGVRGVLEGAVATVKAWHNMDGSDEETWKIYYENSPEMKPIREMLDALSRAESAPEGGKDD